MFFDKKSTSTQSKYFDEDNLKQSQTTPCRTIPDQIIRHSVAAELYLQPVARLIRPLSRPQSGVRFPSNLKSPDSLSSTTTSLPSLTSRAEATPTASTKPPLPPRASSNSTALFAPAALPPMLPRLTLLNSSPDDNIANNTTAESIIRKRTT